MNDNKQKSTFFGEDVKFWLGRVVSYDAQEQQASGTASWGWRYKVRVFGAYADDEITDSDVVYATCMIPNTAGTGAAGGYKTLRISQGDTVFGFYMAPDDGFPVIIGSLGRTDVTKDNPQVLSGFTAEKKPGLTGRQEANEKDGPNIPVLDASTSTKGSGKGKAVNKDAISSQLGIDPDEEPQVDAIKDPPTPITKKGEEIVNSGETSNSPKQTIAEKRAARQEYEAEVEKLKESQGGVIYHDQDEKLREEILYKSRGENSDFVQRVAQNNNMNPEEVSQIITSTEREDQDAKQELLYNIGNDVQENVDYDLDTDFQITPKYQSDGVSINPKWAEERIKDQESFTLY